MGSLKQVGLVVCILALGCSTYSPPRTVPAGQLRHGLILNYLMPSYTSRLGVTERVDVGLQVPYPLGLNVKANPIRGKFDLAMNPGYQYFIGFSHTCTAEAPPSCSGPPGMHAFRLPVQWGVNHDQQLSLVGELGPVFVDATDGEPGLLYQAAIGGITRGQRVDVTPLFQVLFDPSHSLPEAYANGWTWMAIFGASITWSIGSKREY